MSKSYLAFKAVNHDNRSAWVKNPKFQTEYTIGTRVDAKNNNFPFYLATIDEIGEYQRVTGIKMPRPTSDSLEVSTFYSKTRMFHPKFLTRTF